MAIFILISAWSFSYSGPKGIIIISLLTAVAVFQIARVFLKERSELAKAQQELEEDKQVLEIKVKARTKELEEINAQLEKTIEQRTRELKAQIEELERFHRLVVGRELKMIELKKEIQDLKEELEYYKERKLAKTAKSK